jgi:hypothetical protein
MAAPRPSERDAIGLNGDGTSNKPLTVTKAEANESFVALPTTSGKARIAAMQLLINEQLRRAEISVGVSLYNREVTRSARFLGVTRDDIIPIHDELYLMFVGKDSVKFDLVTAALDEKLRPTPGAPTLTLNTAPIRMFWHPDSREEGEVTIESIEGEGDKAKAKVLIQPPAAISRFKDPRREQPKPVRVVVGPGDLLATEHQSYRVTRIIPPQKLKGRRGRLIGWVEIDPQVILNEEADKEEEGKR